MYNIIKTTVTILMYDTKKYSSRHIFVHKRLLKKQKNIFMQAYKTTLVIVVQSTKLMVF